MVRDLILGLGLSMESKLFSDNQDKMTSCQFGSWKRVVKARLHH